MQKIKIENIEGQVPAWRVGDEEPEDFGNNRLAIRIANLFAMLLVKEPHPGFPVDVEARKAKAQAKRDRKNMRRAALHG